MQTEYKTKRKPKTCIVILNYGYIGAAQHELWWRQAVSSRWWRQAVSLCWWRQAVSLGWCVAWLPSTPLTSSPSWLPLTGGLCRGSSAAGFVAALELMATADADGLLFDRRGATGVGSSSI